MRAARILFPLLAGATLLLLGAHAVPSIHRKHLLREERRRLERELAEEERAARRLRAEIDALTGDPFYLERMLVETWNKLPRGAVPFAPAAPQPVVLRAGE